MDEYMTEHPVVFEDSSTGEKYYAHNSEEFNKMMDNPNLCLCLE